MLNFIKSLFNRSEKVTTVSAENGKFRYSVIGKFLCRRSLVWYDNEYCGVIEQLAQRVNEDWVFDYRLYMTGYPLVDPDSEWEKPDNYIHEYVTEHYGHMLPDLNKVFTIDMPWNVARLMHKYSFTDPNTPYICYNVLVGRYQSPNAIKVDRIDTKEDLLRQVPSIVRRKALCDVGAHDKQLFTKTKYTEQCLKYEVSLNDVPFGLVSTPDHCYQFCTLTNQWIKMNLDKTLVLEYPSVEDMKIPLSMDDDRARIVLAKVAEDVYFWSLTHQLWLRS